jgi:hypothetical protein
LKLSKLTLEAKFAVPSKLDGHHKLPIPQFVDGNCVKIVFSWVHTFAHGCCVFKTHMSRMEYFLTDGKFMMV